jgi:hypothetical protein
MLHGKVGWALLALLMFVPFTVWEIWVKKPWDTYERASEHIYRNLALQKDVNGAGDPVESRNHAFWDTLTFFSGEAMSVPGAVLNLRIGELRRDFGEKIAAKAQQAYMTPFITPEGTAESIRKGLDNLTNGIDFGWAPKVSAEPPGGCGFTKEQLDKGRLLIPGENGVCGEFAIGADGTRIRLRPADAPPAKK